MAKTFSIRIKPTNMRGQVLLVVDAIDENGKNLPEYISQQMPQDFAEMVKALHDVSCNNDNKTENK